jgi:hypothetical protein
MAIFNLNRTNVSRSLASTNTGFQATFSGQGGGIFSGGATAFRNIRSQAQSFYMRELLDTKLTKKAFKKLYKACNKFNRYSDTVQIEVLFRKYSDNPQKLEKKSSKIIKKAVNQLAIFNQSYSQIIPIVHDELLKEKQMLWQENNYLATIFRDYQNAMSNSKVYISKEILDAAKETMASAISDEIKNLNKELTEDQNLQRGKVYKGFWSNIFDFGAGHFIHKTKKFIKKWKNAEYKEFKSNLFLLQQEIQLGRVSPVTMTRMVKYTQHFKTSQKLLAEISEDVRQVLFEVNEKIESVIQDSMKFIGMFKTNPDVQRALDELQKLRKSHQQAMNEAANDRGNVERLRDGLMQTKVNLDSTYNEIYKIAQRSLANLQSSVSFSNSMTKT